MNSEEKEPANFNRVFSYVSVAANMFPSVALVLFNTPNDFINDFNRYPESFATVSIVQYSRDSVKSTFRERNSESLEFVNARITDEEMF